MLLFLAVFYQVQTRVIIEIFGFGEEKACPSVSSSAKPGALFAFIFGLHYTCLEGSLNMSCKDISLGPILSPVLKCSHRALAIMIINSFIICLAINNVASV